MRGSWPRNPSQRVIFWPGSIVPWENPPHYSSALTRVKFLPYRLRARFSSFPCLWWLIFVSLSLRPWERWTPPAFRSWYGTRSVQRMSPKSMIWGVFRVQISSVANLMTMLIWTDGFPEGVFRLMQVCCTAFSIIPSTSIRLLSIIPAKLWGFNFRWICGWFE